MSRQEGRHSILRTAHAWLEQGAPFGGVENRSQGQAEGGHQGLVYTPQHAATALTKPKGPRGGALTGGTGAQRPGKGRGG